MEGQEKAKKRQKEASVVRKREIKEQSESNVHLSRDLLYLGGRFCPSCPQ